MAKLAEVVTQTFRTITPDAISERLFKDPLDSWWHEYRDELLESNYTGEVQIAFFIASFAAMGKVAKVDGRIQESEVALASSVMDHLKLDADQKRLAIRLFNEGKRSDFNLDVVLNRFHRLCRHRASVLQVFMEIQCQMAFADGDIGEKEQAMLKRMGKRIDISEAIYLRIERRVRSESVKSAGKPKAAEKPMSLADACQLLGVSRWTPRQETKQAYRRLVSQVHPDKLFARGASEAEVAEATQKMQAIKQAYETVLRARKIFK